MVHIIYLREDFLIWEYEVGTVTYI